MAQSQVVIDGDFTQAMQNGPWSYEYPFAKPSTGSDRITFVATRKMRQNYDSFTAPIIRTTRSFPNQSSVTYPKVEVSAGQVLTSGSYSVTTPATGYLCSFSDPKSIDDVSNVVEWEERWCNVPATRREYGSMTYTQIVGVDVATNNPLQFNSTFDAYDYYEYALTPDDSGNIYDAIRVPPSGEAYFPPVPVLPQLRAPAILNLGEDTGVPVIKVIGGPVATIYRQGVPILAQDSNSELYESIMLCRKSTWIVKATLANI